MTAAASRPILGTGSRLADPTAGNRPTGVTGEGRLTERKPAWMRHETWIDRQIREAQERGDFDNLSGAGKPIPDLDRPFTAERWAVDWVTRQGGDLRGLLPPLLALRR